MKVTAVIPVRSGSQRVKDKNLRPFAGTTLLENKIEVLQQVPELDAIIVNTNSEEAIRLTDEKYRTGGVKFHGIVGKNTMLHPNAQEVSSFATWAK